MFNKKLFFLFFFLCNTVFAQQDSVLHCNGDVIRYRMLSDSSFRIQIGKQVVDCNAAYLSDNSFNITLNAKCLVNGFDFIVKGRRILEYEIHHFIFYKKDNDYFLENYYEHHYDRYFETFDALPQNRIAFKDFKGIPSNDKFFEKAKGIYFVDGFQDPKGETVHIDYYSAVKKAYQKKNLKEVALFTNECVLNELNILNYDEEKLNNIGFYASESGAYLNASIILKAVVKQFPERVTAYLNLADTFYAMDKKAEAKQCYLLYIEKMKVQNKDLNKIPDRVYQRI